MGVVNIERWQVLEQLISGNLILNRGVEVGVWRGKTTHYLLKKFPQLSLICVDPYKVYDHFKKYHQMGQYADQIEFSALAESLKYDLLKKYPNRVWWIQKESLVAAPMVEDGSLDFAFIDANYGYDYVKQDILAWYRKVRIGGIFFGQIIDSSKDSPNSVKRAVEETIGTDYQVRERRWYHIKKGDKNEQKENQENEKEN